MNSEKVTEDNTLEIIKLKRKWMTLENKEKKTD